jgi:glucose/arabinose dehydrogenase
MGLVADPNAGQNRHFYTCQAVATTRGGAKGIEVWKWRLTSDTSAVKVRALITGIPLTSGRHSGCRLRFRSARMLYVGTGDAARGTNPQNLGSLGGKVLRVRNDGSIPTTNPFYRRGGKARYVYSFGHRNVQGLARRPGSGQMWSVEQGTSRNDEVNRVFSGGNYGWNPVPGYNEARPMTDKRRYPNATRAKWSSGASTVATSGATFISGSRWGSWNGRLAVAMLKGEGVKLLTLRGDRVTGTSNVLRSYGRIRTVQQGPDGALYFTTSNGSRRDAIYRVTAG